MTKLHFYKHFDAEGWLGWEDSYCLTCLKEECRTKWLYKPVYLLKHFIGKHFRG